MTPLCIGSRRLFARHPVIVETTFGREGFLKDQARAANGLILSNDPGNAAIARDRDFDVHLRRFSWFTYIRPNPLSISWPAITASPLSWNIPENVCIDASTGVAIREY